MKVIIREYLASLRERDELDAILPDLLSELGYTILSRPGRGTTQFGVDFAAIGGPDDERKVYLFSIKGGDLTRTDWHSVPQGLRASLDSIQDGYVPHRIPVRYRHLKVVICVCFGGELKESVQSEVHSYTAKRQTDELAFEIWDGEHIAELLLKGVLREKLLPTEQQSSFRKAVALVDEPDAAFGHFKQLVRQLVARGKTSPKAGVTAARQINIALWILYVWGRSVGNLEAPYRASELAVLAGWEILRSRMGKKSATATATARAVDQLIKLHLDISGLFLNKVVLPHADKLHALSFSVPSSSPLDINLKLFDLLGRLGIWGLWSYWILERAGDAAPALAREELASIANKGLELIRNNPTLGLPVSDYQTTDIAVFLMFWAYAGGDIEDVRRWLAEIVGRYNFAIMTGGAYPCTLHDYADLALHPVEASEAYLKEVTEGSTLIPFLSAWVAAVGETSAAAELVKLVARDLPHCTLQTWMPDAATEDALYMGGSQHGVALSSLPLTESGKELIGLLQKEIERDTECDELSAMAYGLWPLAIMAFRYHHLPIPPQFWVPILSPSFATVDEPTETA